MRKGHEFELQVSVPQEGKRYQPDAIIRLPDGKDIIVDSKVSLKAYEQYCSTEETDITAKQRLLREHLMSMRGHIKGLSDKAYQALDGVGSLDFVLLFIPVEGAFLLALEKEPDLFKEAFDRNIMLVSPSTLMVTLRTIHNIWRYDIKIKMRKRSLNVVVNCMTSLSVLWNPLMRSVATYTEHKMHLIRHISV